MMIEMHSYSISIISSRAKTEHQNLDLMISRLREGDTVKPNYLLQNSKVQIDT